MQADTWKAAHLLREESGPAQIGKRRSRKLKAHIAVSTSDDPTEAKIVWLTDDGAVPVLS